MKKEGETELNRGGGGRKEIIQKEETIQLWNLIEENPS